MRSRLAFAVAAAGCLLAQPLRAADTTAKRFAINASATLTPDAPTQRAAGFHLRAQLQRSRAPALAPPAQMGSGFSLVASASAIATACYNDTVFRDDFDGDGL